MKTIEYVALFLIGAGIIGIAGWAARAFFIDPGVPIVLKLLAGLALVGFVTLLGYVTWDRVRKARQEPKEIREVRH
ncbi:MAG: hypothetical protein SV910_04255 [Chloroflexota bacterium]|nr:hypothetical protein [Chloroflexota bacterium]